MFNKNSAHHENQCLKYVHKEIKLNGKRKRRRDMASEESSKNIPSV